MFKRFISRINVIDILIIILILIIVGSIAYRALFSNFSSNRSQYEISLISENCPTSVSEQIYEESECFEFESRVFIGKITSKSTTPSQARNDLKITLLLEAKKSEHGIESNGINLLVGKYLNIVSGNCVFSARIEAIKNKV